VTCAECCGVDGKIGKKIKNYKNKLKMMKNFKIDLKKIKILKNN
jgi:hypothetical protein